MRTKNYQIKWYYGIGDTKVFTYCYLLKGEETICGHAECSKKDNFSRDTGRRVSLARVMKKAELPKEERAEIWEAYRNMKVGGRW